MAKKKLPVDPIRQLKFLWDEYSIDLRTIDRTLDLAGRLSPLKARQEAIWWWTADADQGQGRSVGDQLGRACYLLAQLRQRNQASFTALCAGLRRYCLSQETERIEVRAAKPEPPSRRRRRGLAAILEF